jgi:23S rRNA (pseudouridine1915-N3)-methyltransferase
MVFHILAVGRVRDAALREACEKYASRADRYFKLKIVEVSDAGRGTRAAAEARRMEGTALLKKIPPGTTAVALTREGESEDSPGFADRMARWQLDAHDVVFVIGGAGGLDPAVIARCDGKLSLSRWTLPHELARVVLLEQIYRAGTILKGEPYHKGPR